MKKLRFYLRWARRDARERWLLLVSIALITALGTAVFSAFGHQREWREKSLDRSYEMLNMFDLRMELTEGSFVDQTDITSALSQVDGVEVVDTRLLVPTLLDASKDGKTILYPGRIVGLDVSDGGPTINKLNVIEGRNLTAADSGENVVIIDYLFTKYRELEPGDPSRIAGGTEMDFVGRGQTPDNFTIIPGEGGLSENENTFAVMYTTLETAQQLSGRDHLVNDILLQLSDDADLDAVEAEITRLIDDQFDGVGFAFTRKADDPGLKAMYADAKGDQRLWNIIGGLFLFGAALATFNLAGRIVEAQRRQIGIGMALGVKPIWLAVRPILFGVQIAILGTIFGLALGYPITHLLAGVMDEFYPLPYWGNPFYIQSYLLAAALGIIVPLLATLYPVIRAVRVEPIDAIQTGYLVAKGGGLTRLMKHLPIPGRSFTQMPFRNILRSPWRTFLTIIGVSIAILLLVATSGLLDTFDKTLNQATDFYLTEHPDRISVYLDSPYPIDSSQTDALTATFIDVQRIETLRQLKTEDGDTMFRKVDVGMVMMGTLDEDDADIPVLIEMFDPEAATWQPEVVDGALPDGERGIVISQKAADELDVKVGDSITLSHPQREGMLNYRMVETQLPVIGIHSNPMRSQTYMSLNQADLMGIEGFANKLILYPNEAVSQDDVRRALFQQPGVASIQVVKEIPDSFEEILELVNAVLIVVQLIVMVMAFLIAFNSTSINLDERVREIATMFAFGLPVRTVIRMQVVENFITGLFGTLLGIAVGYGVLIWIVNGQVAEMIPEIHFATAISTSTVIAAGVLGIVVVSLTPLLSIRRMWTMDIPSKLRVME